MRTTKNPIRVHETTFQSGIRRSKKFEEKKLAAYAVNVGAKCGHDCLYCSTGAMLRTHKCFKTAGESPYGTGYAIVDPNTPQRVAVDACRQRRRGLIQLCTTTDAWSPEAQQLGLGRACLEAILGQPGWTVRILTKNAAVVNDFDVIRRHRDRVLVGLSLTGTPDASDIMEVVEPNASTIQERMAAMRQASRLGLRTYGMLCPLLPGIADSSERVDELVKFAADIGVEEIFAEPVNPRGRGLILTEAALRQHGFVDEAQAVADVRRRDQWSAYVVRLVHSVQKAVRRHFTTDGLRFLLYPKGLTPEAYSEIQADDGGVVWLD